MKRKEQILKDIETIFRNEFNDQTIEITTSSSANTVEKWDSINNLYIIDAIEKHFNISFPVDVIFSAQNVGDLIAHILDNKVA